MKKLLQYIPLALGILILVISGALVPWPKVMPYFTKLPAIDYAILIGLGFAFYLTRILRYSYILHVLKESNVSKRKVGLSYMIGQPISLVPGGEFYRSVLLQKYADVSFKNGLPTVFIQSLTEGFGLVMLALIGAIIIQKYVLIVLGVGLIYIFAMVAIQLHNNGRRSHSLINRLPFVNISLRKLRSFLGKNKQALSGWSLIVLLISSIASTMVLVVAMLIAALGFGVELSFTQALIAVTLPLILQYATFLPGGFGINEQGSVGILLLMQVSLPAAVALTIVIRFISLWLGLLLGIAAIGYARASSNHPN